MGNLARLRKAFQEAVEYRAKRARYNDARTKWEAKRDAADKPAPEPPKVDHGLETLARVLSGEILVHNHCYRADEMLRRLELAESFGFRIRSFHHAVEAYKIADRLAASDTAASVWADWWGFKAEAYDGIVENAALLQAAGARAIIHSDSARDIQRLNQEAAKAMYAGRRAGLEISDDEALRWITANPAWALGVEDQTGTLEPGKLADLVVWDGDPFSVYTKTRRVYIDGAVVYDRRDPALQPRTDFNLGLLPGGLSVEGPVAMSVRRERMRGVAGAARVASRLLAALFVVGASAAAGDGSFYLVGGELHVGQRHGRRGRRHRGARRRHRLGRRPVRTRRPARPSSTREARGSRRG